MEKQETITPFRLSVNKALALVMIASILIGSIFWIANVSATASHADSLSQQNSSEIQKKADKDDLKEIKQDIKDIRDFLMDGKGRAR